MDTAARERLLRIYPVLRDLPPDLLRRVEEAVTPLQARAGQEMFGDRGPCTHYPLLVEGTLRVSKTSADGRELLLYRLLPGESCVITVVALLGGTSYPATGTAETKLSLFGIPRHVFLEMIVTSPAFRIFVFESLSRRMLHLMTLIDDVAFRRVDERLASRLLGESPPIAVTHQMLADELGTTREVVSRTLEAFQQSGMIRLGRKRIEIVDRNALDRVRDLGRFLSSAAKARTPRPGRRRPPVPRASAPATGRPRRRHAR